MIGCLGTTDWNDFAGLGVEPSGDPGVPGCEASEKERWYGKKRNCRIIAALFRI